METGRLELARLSLAGGKSLHAVLEVAAEIIASVLGVKRVSIWLYVVGRSAIRCDVLFQPDHNLVCEGTILHAKDFPLISRYRDMLTMAAGPAATLAFDIKARVGMVFIDANQVERMLLDLVLNSRDALNGRGTIAISLRESRRAGASNQPIVYTVLEMSDTGQGMEEATQERMFEPYFTSKGVGGSGLGLAIATQIVADATLDAEAATT